MKILHRRYKDDPSSTGDSCAGDDGDGDGDHGDGDGDHGEDRHCKEQSEQSSGHMSLDVTSIQPDLDVYLEIIQILCKMAPEMVHCMTKEEDTPLDVPHIMMLRDISSKPEFEERLLQVYQILKQTSINVYKEQKRIWERRKDHGQSQEVLTMPSLTSSNGSSFVSQENSGGDPSAGVSRVSGISMVSGAVSSTNNGGVDRFMG